MLNPPCRVKQLSEGFYIPLGGLRNDDHREASGCRPTGQIFEIDLAARRYTASDCDVKRNCLIFSAGSSAELVPCDSELLTRSGALINSTLPGASISSKLWLKRKLRTGYRIFPFSMSQTPSRVSPVCTSVRTSTNRRYQKRLTSRPRSVERIISSMLAGGCALCSMALTGPGVGSLAFCLAQNRE